MNEINNDNEDEYEGITGWLYKERYGLLKIFAFLGAFFIFSEFTKGTDFEGKFLESGLVFLVIWWFANGGSFSPSKKNKK